MICPKCKAEYREGFIRCTDCGVALLRHAPIPTEPAQSKGFVTVFKTGDLMEADAIALELQRRHVPFFRRVENLSSQELAMPAFPTPGIGTFWIIRVPTDAEPAARAIIDKLPFQPRAGPSTPTHQKPSKLLAWIPFAAILLIATMVGGLVYTCVARP